MPPNIPLGIWPLSDKVSRWSRGRVADCGQVENGVGTCEGGNTACGCNASPEVVARQGSDSMSSGISGTLVAGSQVFKARKRCWMSSGKTCKP
jgi:hypothetical protein